MISIDIHKKLKGNQGSFNLEISEEIKKHDFIGLFGNSGSGKTSLLRILSGLDKPDSGKIIVNNTVWFDSNAKINLLPQKRLLGYVFQEDVLFPNMNVLENLQFASPKGNNKKALLELIDLMELNGLLKAPIQQLSGGQKQRVSLARTLVQQPKLLLLDEPLSALDYTMRIKLQEHIVKAHNTYGLTSIIVSHDPWELNNTASKIWKIENGLITKKGKPTAVLPIDNI